MDSAQPSDNRSLTFYEEDMQRINEIMEALVSHSRSQSAMLVDRSGNMISRYGEAIGFDPQVVSALVAGSFAVTREVARILGDEEFSATFHQGSRGSIQMSIVSDRAILALVFNDETTAGMVRIYADQAVKRLGAVFERVLARTGESGGDQTLDKDFHKEAQGRIDEMFDEKA